MSESEQPTIPAPNGDAAPSDTGAVGGTEQENAPRAAESEAIRGADDGDQEPAKLGSAEAESGAQRDPEDWVTGDQPATGPQKSYLDSLARKAGEEIDPDLTKAEASEHIDRLQQETGTGTS